MRVKKKKNPRLSSSLLKMKVKGNTAFVELFMSYPFDMLIYTLHS